MEHPALRRPVRLLACAALTGLVAGDGDGDSGSGSDSGSDSGTALHTAGVGAAGGTSAAYVEHTG